jgi:hypothetical protein
VSEASDIAPPEMPLAFDSDGRPVLVTEPAVYDEPQADGPGGLDLEPILDLFITGARNPREVGERVAILAFLMPRVNSRAKSLRELGAFLGCSHVAARSRLNRLRRILASELSDRLNSTRIGDEENL